MMTGFDYAVLVIMGFSVLLSIMRGLTQEVLSLLSWIVALWSASHYADQVSVLLPLQTAMPETRILVAFIAILIAVWLATLCIKLVISRFINMVGLGAVDRILGSVFGLVRGGIFVLVFVLAAGFTKFPQLPMWRNAMFSPLFVSIAMETLPWLPPALARKIHY
jgi:membrane protein required for colicin V production